MPTVPAPAKAVSRVVAACLFGEDFAHWVIEVQSFPLLDRDTVVPVGKTKGRAGGEGKLVLRVKARFVLHGSCIELKSYDNPCELRLLSCCE